MKMGDSSECVSNNSPYCANCSSDEEWMEVHCTHEHNTCDQQDHQAEEGAESPKVKQSVNNDNDLVGSERSVQCSTCEQHRRRVNASTCYDDINSSYDDFWSDNGAIFNSLPGLVPLTRQQSSDTGYLFDGRDFDDETMIKSRRAVRKEDPNDCKGKTRRRKEYSTFYRQCTGPVFETGTKILYDHKADKLEDSVTPDGRRFWRVPCKKNDWDALRGILSEAAVRTHVEPRKPRYCEPRKVESFDLECSVNAPHVPVKSQRQSTVYSRKILPFKSGVYYTMRIQTNPDDRFDEDEDFSAYVREVPKPNSIVLKGDEYYCDFVPTFLSRNTKQAKDSRLCHATICSSRLKDELSSYGYRSRGRCASQRSAKNYQYCWASQPAVVNERARKMDGNSYQDWFLEMDLKTERKVRALVIQGRAPIVTRFPLDVHLDHLSDRYTGPFYPIIDLGNPHNQWVEKVEVLVRAHRGEWHSLGIYKANEDCLNEVRIDLDLSMDVRYVRVRPLSKRQGGYHGDAPAMRCAVVAERVRTGKQRILHNDKAMVSGHLPYTLYTPDEKKLGLNSKASYVSGPAIKICATLSKNYTPYYAQPIAKDDSARFQKRKAVQALIKDGSMFEEPTSSSYALDGFEDDDEEDDAIA